MRTAGCGRQPQRACVLPCDLLNACTRQAQEFRRSTVMPTRGELPLKHDARDAARASARGVTPCQSAGSTTWMVWWRLRMAQPRPHLADLHCDLCAALPALLPSRGRRSSPPALPPARSELGPASSAPYRPPLRPLPRCRALPPSRGGFQHRCLHVLNWAESAFQASTDPARCWNLRKCWWSRCALAAGGEFCCAT
jgi:hypothetical protein